MGIGEELEHLASDAGREVVKHTLGHAQEYANDLSDRGAKNVGAVIRRFIAKVGGKHAPPGEVSPKVLVDVAREAQTAEDEFTRDYLAGVLASGRSPDGRDDRAAAFARLVGDLSVYSLRAHYILYARHQRLSVGKPLGGISNGSLNEALFFTHSDFLEGMRLTTDEMENYDSILLDIGSSLSRTGLLGFHSYGPSEYLTTVSTNIGKGPRAFPAPGVILTPTSYGAVFFLAARGCISAPDANWVADVPTYLCEEFPVVPSAVYLAELPTIETPDSP